MRPDWFNDLQPKEKPKPKTIVDGVLYTSGIIVLYFFSIFLDSKWCREKTYFLRGNREIVPRFNSVCTPLLLL